MRGLIQYFKEQVYSLLFFVKQKMIYIPFICLIATAIAFVSHISICWDYFVNDVSVSEYIYSDKYLTVYTLADHYFGCTLPTLLIFSAMSFYESWGKIANYPLIYLWAMWVIVHIDIAFLPNKDIIFYSFVSLFYLTFVFLSVNSLINRNVK